MKEIKLLIEDDAYKLMQRSLSLTFLLDNQSSVSEQAISKIMQAIEDGQDEVELRKRHEI